jgi:hypothetical protein
VKGPKVETNPMSAILAAGRRPLVVITLIAACAVSVRAHHSLAMYDLKKTYVLTGVVVRVDPNPNHLQLFVSPLNDARDQVLKDSRQQPIVWAIELDAAGVAAREGVTVNSFPRGTIVSVGLHPLRTSQPAGARSKFPLFKCPADTPPAAGKHCDSVKGSQTFGQGTLPAPTGPLPAPAARSAGRG